MCPGVTGHAPPPPLAGWSELYSSCSSFFSSELSRKPQVLGLAKGITSALLAVTAVLTQLLTTQQGPSQGDSSGGRIRSARALSNPIQLTGKCEPPEGFLLIARLKKFPSSSPPVESLWQL